VGNEMTLQTGLHDWQAMKEQANVLIKSGFLPSTINTPEKALAIALSGRELGIGFMESIRSINVIQGKPTISPQLMLARAYQTKEVEDVKIDSTDKRCIVTIKRKGKTPITSEFGVKEATDLGLMSKDNYRKQPKTMFMWRALAANLRVTFPDVTSGLYTPEEMGATVAVGENDAMEVVHPGAIEADVAATYNGVLVDESPLDRPITETIAVPASSKQILQERLPQMLSDPKPKDDLPLGVMQAEIKDWLDVMYQGDLAKMNEHVKSVTTWKDKKTGQDVWLDLPKLMRLGEPRKAWVGKIHERIGAAYNDFASKQP
jgi:hypothetical protein